MNLRPLPPEAGFGARRQQGPAISYFVKYRTADGRQRWQVIGRHGVLTPDDARDKARAILGDVVDGADPAAEKMAARKAITVAELCDLYLVDAEAGRLLTRRRGAKKASTLLTDRGRITRHIKPLLGRMAVAAVDRTDIERFMHGVAEGKTAGRIKTGRFGLARVNGGKGTATRTVGLLDAIFTYAVRCARACGRTTRFMASCAMPMGGAKALSPSGSGIGPGDARVLRRHEQRANRGRLPARPVE